MKMLAEFGLINNNLFTFAAKLKKQMKGQLEHDGTVASVCDNAMIVRIAAQVSCSGCAARERCLPSGNGGRDIRIEGFSSNFIEGEKVKVVLRQSLGIKALCIGYVIPLVVTLTALVAARQVTDSELASGLAALLILIPYYLIIKLLNRKITKTFGFTVKKINVA